jgi:hypothetical protein
MGDVPPHETVQGAMFHHMKPAEAPDQCLTDEHTDQQQTDVEDPVEDERPAMRKSRVLLPPKTIEILEFLGTAEMGEGCSREHAQGWLDCQKKRVEPVQLCCLRIFGLAGTTLPRFSFPFLAFI